MKSTGEEKVTRECFFLEERSSVVSYKLSTKLRRHGTFTSFFTVCGRTKKLVYESIFYQTAVSLLYFNCMQVDRQDIIKSPFQD